MVIDAALRALKPKEKDYKVAATTACITTKGAKSFRMDYRLRTHPVEVMGRAPALPDVGSFGWGCRLCPSTFQPSLDPREVPNDASWGKGNASRELPALLRLTDRAVGKRRHLAELIPAD
jgi:hypothetical protein